MPEPTKDSTGDTMQSAATRLAAWARGHMVDDRPPRVPYEVQLAVFEVETSSREWTDLRRQDA